MQESTAKLRALPSLATVVSTARAAATHSSPSVIRAGGATYSGAQGLLNSDTSAPDAILLYPHDSTEALSWSRALRADERFALLPIFSARAFEGDFADLTDGAFDPTVQPLWQLYARHFSSDRPDPEGPPKEKLAEALAKTDDIAGAGENYAAYLKILPNGPHAKKAREALSKLKDKPPQNAAKQ